MCGRFARYQPLEAWVEALGNRADPALFESLRGRDTGPRYNIAPSTKAWTAGFDDHDDLVFDERLWRFPTPRGNRINVRSETAHRVPAYRDAYSHHHCVVLANGFYEPKGLKTEKNRPWFYFQPRDETPLFLGAIAGESGFSILTRTPVPPVAGIHDRSPVLVPADNVLAWLDGTIPDPETLRHFAPPDYGRSLTFWRVGDGAKKPGNEGPDLMALYSDDALF